MEDEVDLEALLAALVVEAYEDIEAEGDDGAFIGYEEGVLAGILRTALAFGLLAPEILQDYLDRGRTTFYGGERPFGNVALDEVDRVAGLHDEVRQRFVGRERARTIACPRCGAASGDYCQGLKGPRVSNHDERAAALLERDAQAGEA